jgi:Skp family chaperone for outer membrane proteins
VDTKLLLDSIPGRPDAESAFALEATKARLLVAEAADSLKRAVDDFTRERDAMSPARREAVLLVLRAREITFEDMVRQLEVMGETRRQELRAPFEQRIAEAITTVRRREGVSLVFERAGAPALLDYDEAVDLTRLVLAELRRLPSTPAAPLPPARPR